MIQLPHPQGELLLAKTTDQIQSAFDGMVSERLPGFQIGPEVPTQEALTVLASLVNQFHPGFAFDECLNGASTLPTPKIADSCAQSQSGLIVDVNDRPVGEVWLQSAKPDVVTTEDLEEADLAGPCLGGLLRHRTKTVYSGRIQSEGEVILGATVYKFLTLPFDATRYWTRYTGRGIYPERVTQLPRSSERRGIGR